MRYDLVMFDFDGTLADSFPFLVSVFNGLAQRHGFTAVAPEEVAGLRRLDARQIMRALGMPAWKLPIVAKHFIRLMRAAQPVPLFPGVAEVVHGLAGRGVTLAIVSSNAYENVERVLGPHLMPCFAHFECGASVFGKGSRLRKVLAHSGTTRERAMYIGDQPTDLAAARAAQVAFGAVAWGYGDVAAFQGLAPAALFTRPEDILGILDA